MNDKKEFLPAAGFSQFVNERVPSFEQMLSDWLELEAKDGKEIISINSVDDLQKTSVLKPMEVLASRPGDSHVQKEGGRLWFRKDGLVINEVPNRAAKIWAELTQGLPTPADILAGNDNNLIIPPIAPILLDKDGKLRIIPGEETSKVFSRFCGFDVSYLRDVLKKVNKSINPEDYDSFAEIRRRAQGKPEPGSENEIGLRSRIQNFLETVSLKEREIENWLNALGVDHQNVDMHHTHEGNFIVEFVKKDDFETKLKGRRELNTSSDPGLFSFSVRDYLIHPEDYEVVVRLIDWDIANVWRGQEIKFGGQKELSGLLKLVNKAKITEEGVLKAFRSKIYLKNAVALAALNFLPQPWPEAVFQELEKVLLTPFNYELSPVAARRVKNYRLEWPENFSNGLVTAAKERKISLQLIEECLDWERETLPKATADIIDIIVKSKDAFAKMAVAACYIDRALEQSFPPDKIKSWIETILTSTETDDDLAKHLVLDTIRDSAEVTQLVAGDKKLAQIVHVAQEKDRWGEKSGKIS